MTTRRETLAAGLACALAGLSASHRGRAEPRAPRFALRDLTLGPGEAPFGGRVPALVPRAPEQGERWPLVIALHGLGESSDPALAARAWPELYGLADAAERLFEPPILPRGARDDLGAVRAAELTRELAARPFAGLIVVCPFTPSPARARDRGAHLARYAAWIRDVVIARAREQLPAIPTPIATHVAGCSMGGAVALEVAVRSPGAFASVAIVQSAHGAHRNTGFATGLAKAGPGGRAAAALVLTSRGDPFLASNLALVDALARHGVPHEASVLEGPHDQAWLREAGTPLLLHGLDRRPRS